MNRVWSSQGVSPVVAVILMVAITVILSAVIGTFVLDLGQQATSGGQSDIGVQTSSDGENVTVTIVTGDADKVSLLVNGTEVDNATNVTAGTVLSATNVSSSATVTIVSSEDGSRTVVSSEPATSVGVSGSTTSSGSNGLTGPVLIDSFEDNSFTEYTIVSSDAGTPTNDSATSTNGSDSLSLVVGASSGDNAALYSSSGDGLEQYPEPGTTTTLDVWTNASSTGSSFVYFGGQNNSNSYSVRFVHDKSDFRLSVVQGGTRTVLQNTSLSLSGSTWYRLNITWETSGAITVTVKDQTGSQLASISATNTTYSNGLIGFERNLYSGTVQSRFDNVTVKPAG